MPIRTAASQALPPSPPTLRISRHAHAVHVPMIEYVCLMLRIHCGAGSSILCHLTDGAPSQRRTTWNTVPAGVAVSRPSRSQYRPSPPPSGPTTLVSMVPFLATGKMAREGSLSTRSWNCSHLVSPRATRNLYSLPSSPTSISRGSRHASHVPTM